MTKPYKPLPGRAREPCTMCGQPATLVIGGDFFCDASACDPYKAVRGDPSAFADLFMRDHEEEMRTLGKVD